MSLTSDKEKATMVFWSQCSGHRGLLSINEGTTGFFFFFFELGFSHVSPPLVILDPLEDRNIMFSLS